MTENLQELRFPIGEFACPAEYRAEEIAEAVARIAALPDEIGGAVAGLDDRQLDTSYRPDGWSVRQVVHHLADSHINSWCRFRLALTEDRPTIRTYDEKSWAMLPDASGGPVALSLDLLRTLHRRWVILLRSLDDRQWIRPLDHPELGPMELWQLGHLYAWHGRHHTAQVTRLRQREGW